MSCCSDRAIHLDRSAASRTGSLGRDRLTRRQALRRAARGAAGGVALPWLTACATGSSPSASRASVPRLGVLFTDMPPLQFLAYSHAIRALGHDATFVTRLDQGQLDRLPALAAELVGLAVDVLITGATPHTRAAMEATTTIPIVMAKTVDPVASGLVASLARPGGNVTGLAA